MLFVITHRFKENIAQAREAARPAHLDHLQGAGKRLKAAGPLLDPENPDKAQGSMIIIDADSRMAANLFVTTDPYVKAGIIADTKISGWKAVLGDISADK